MLLWFNKLLYHCLFGMTYSIFFVVTNESCDNHLSVNITNDTTNIANLYRILLSYSYPSSGYVPIFSISNGHRQMCTQSQTSKLPRICHRWKFKLLLDLSGKKVISYLSSDYLPSSSSINCYLIILCSQFYPDLLDIWSK